jgi:hypothetical protein
MLQLMLLKLFAQIYTRNGKQDFMGKNKNKSKIHNLKRKNLIQKQSAGKNQARWSRALEFLLKRCKIFKEI